MARTVKRRSILANTPNPVVGDLVETALGTGVLVEVPTLAADGGWRPALVNLDPIYVMRRRAEVAVDEVASLPPECAHLKKARIRPSAEPHEAGDIVITANNERGVLLEVASVDMPAWVDVNPERVQKRRDELTALGRLPAYHEAIPKVTTSGVGTFGDEDSPATARLFDAEEKKLSPEEKAIPVGTRFLYGRRRAEVVRYTGDGIWEVALEETGGRKAELLKLQTGVLLPMLRKTTPLFDTTKMTKVTDPDYHLYEHEPREQVHAIMYRLQRALGDEVVKLPAGDGEHHVEGFIGNPDTILERVEKALAAPSVLFPWRELADQLRTQFIEPSMGMSPMQWNGATATKGVWIAADMLAQKQEAGE